MDNYYAMIMAGGGGTRLWPMSRKHTPKQMLPLVEDDSMFKISVDRLMPLFPPERIYVVTGEAYADALHADTPYIPKENFIIEPYGKDSGPAAGLGVAVIQHRDPNAVIAILTADHHIQNKARFRDVLAAAYTIAQEQDMVVTLGISPSFPSTGFGYIRRGHHLGEMGDFNYYESRGFKEKPEPAVAIRYLRSGEYSWNSGMFIWTAEHAMREFKHQQPDMHTVLTHIGAAVDSPNFTEVLKQHWEAIPRISLDYAVMEQAEDMCVIPIDVGWSDVGSWGALYDILDKDESENCYKGKPDSRINIDTQASMIFSDRLVVTVGIRDIVVIDTGDALLICHKDRTQEVKDVVRELKNNENDNYL